MLDGPGRYSRKARMTYFASAAFLLTFLAPMGVPSTGAVPVQRARAGPTVFFTRRTLRRGLKVVFMVREALALLLSRPGSATWRWLP